MSTQYKYSYLYEYLYTVRILGGNKLSIIVSLPGNSIHVREYTDTYCSILEQKQIMILRRYVM